ncbi:hypothetical protein E4582_04395 [Luteimonas yindakuii]|uniref:Uncharacterized protein n=1 Tax=Luteimonas yindakuii TaxID=2565782 RepID=A0A4Z1R6C4_9GAMM|nr:hypothetical protein [Luteimonas yindakuii]TKS54085.1 hypothetical protein E4582_04395 [Luteimonas yindakuii]
MNRKLHNTILAFSFTGLAAVLMLLAAGPLPQMPTSTDVHLAGCGGASNAAPMTAIGTSAVMATAGVAEPARTDASRAVAGQDEAQAAPRRARLRHQALAMPYFSFAQELRPVGS